MRTVIQVRAVIIEALLLELSGPDRFHLIVGLTVIEHTVKFGFFPQTIPQKRLRLISAAFRNPPLADFALRAFF